MSFNLVNDRSAAKAASVAELWKHIHYLSDKSHPDHKDKVKIFPPSLANVTPESIEEFVKLIVQSHLAYLQYRDGKKGKRTSKIWDETIYRTPDNTKLSKKERKRIKRKLLSIRPGEPALLQEHYNKIRKSWDFHLISPVKSIFWPHKVILSGEYGAGKAHILNALEELDDELADELNQDRPADEQIISMRERKRAKAKEALGDLPTLAEEIASVAKETVTRENLADVIKSLGHEVTRPPTETSRYITIRYKGRWQKRRHNVEDLLLDVSSPPPPAGSSCAPPGVAKKPPLDTPIKPNSPTTKPAPKVPASSPDAAGPAKSPKPTAPPPGAGNNAQPKPLSSNDTQKPPGGNRQGRSGRPSGNDDPTPPGIS